MRRRRIALHVWTVVALVGALTLAGSGSALVGLTVASTACITRRMARP